MANVFLRDTAGWRGVGGYVAPAPDPDPDPDPGDPPPPPPPPDRPALSAPPSASTTGPRVSLTGSTLSSEAAIAAAVANGGTLVGRRISSLAFNQPAHAGLIFQDCQIGTEPGVGFRPVNGWYTVSPKPSTPVILDHCTVVGGSSASVIGEGLILLHCDVFGGVDCFKPFGPMEAYACWIHDTWHTETAHCDTVQVQSGADILFHWCNIQAFNHPASPTNGGLPASGGLQTGSMIGNLPNFRMLDNWVDGGGFTLRGADKLNGHTVSQTFRRNKHGRNYTFGPFTKMDTPGVSYDSSNVWADTGQPVQGG